jgi:co-chaperonin GroES (HSP10)
MTSTTRKAREISAINGLHLPRGSSLGMARGQIVAVAEGVKKLREGDEVYFATQGRSNASEAITFHGETLVVCTAEAVLARVVRR